MVTSGHDVDVDRDLVGEDTSSHDCLCLGLLEDGVSLSILYYCYHEAAKSLFSVVVQIQQNQGDEDHIHPPLDVPWRSPLVQRYRQPSSFAQPENLYKH